ncbi:MAG: 5'-3' exonuclease [Actinomycetota bacterium]
MAAGKLTLMVDASSLIYRAYFSVPDSVKADDGTPVNAAYGFLNMLARLIGDLKPARVACCLDADWRPQWRVDLLESYKLHRVAEDGAPEDPVEAQIPMIEDLLALAGIAAIGSPDCEAEDVIATLIKRARKRPTAIVSGDRDLFQLVEDPYVWVLYPKRGVSDLVRVDEKWIEERYGIPGRAYADFAILRGDPSDGLPGVPGIGEKTATLLIAKHGSLDGVVKAAKGATSGPLGKVAVAEEYVRRAADVVRMKGDCSVPEIDLTLGAQPMSKKLPKLAKELRLTGPVGRLTEALASVRK